LETVFLFFSPELCTRQPAQYGQHTRQQNFLGGLFAAAPSATQTAVRIRLLLSVAVAQAAGFFGGRLLLGDNGYLLNKQILCISKGLLAQVIIGGKKKMQNKKWARSRAPVKLQFGNGNVVSLTA
jgi:hypothetical protein